MCTRFYKISNDCELWKNLYHDLYEYDQPLFYSIPEGQYRFKFIPFAECEAENPWKESFKQLVCERFMIVCDLLTFSLRVC